MPHQTSYSCAWTPLRVAPCVELVLLVISLLRQPHDLVFPLIRWPDRTFFTVPHSQRHRKYVKAFTLFALLMTVHLPNTFPVKSIRRFSLIMRFFAHPQERISPRLRCDPRTDFSTPHWQRHSQRIFPLASRSVSPRTVSRPDFRPVRSVMGFWPLLFILPGRTNIIAFMRTAFRLIVSDGQPLTRAGLRAFQYPMFRSQINA